MKQPLFTLLFGFLTLVCVGQEEALRKKHFNLEGGIALSGYDAVAYLNQSKAIKGNRNFAVTHQGVTYHFATAANKEEFRKAPSRYEPAYGGWCAYAMGSNGEKVSVDPKTFKIVNGKLNLFYNRFFNNTLEDWNKDESSLKRKADQHWEKIFQ